MLGEIRLVVAPRNARLTIRKGDDIVEDEVWSFDRQIGQSEAMELVRAIFDDSYDALNWLVHGDD
jgi:hypothetical protein